MLHQDTEQLRVLKEDFNFITNQCLEEAQRVGRDNCDLLIDHFLTMSQIKCAYYTQQHLEWAELMKRLQPKENVEVKPLQSTDLKLQMQQALSKRLS